MDKLEDEKPDVKPTIFQLRDKSYGDLDEREFYHDDNDHDMD